MSAKPDDVSQEAWEAAQKVEHASCVCHLGQAFTGPTVHTVRCCRRVGTVARAIDAAVAAEREACAVLAALVTKAPGQRNAKDQWREQIGAEVATAIRKRGEA